MTEQHSVGLPPSVKACQVVEIQDFIDRRYGDRNIDQCAKALYACAHDALNKLLVGDISGANKCLDDMNTLRPIDSVVLRQRFIETTLLPK